jgi:YD repeat-containing protein
MPLADVYGASQVSPWTGMSLEKLASAQSEDGFTQGDGKLFTWVLHNSANGTLDQCVAFLDALAQTDDDIDSGTLTVTNGKRVNTWYSYDATGRIVTRSGADSLGLFIENVPVADQQRIVFTDDSATGCTYPFFVDFRIVVGAFAAADSNAWFHVWEATGYGTPAAVTVLDSDGNPMKGSVGGLSTISKSYNYDADPSDLDVVVECEGDGGCTQAKATGTITRTAIVSLSCAPSLENNM